MVDVKCIVFDGSYHDVDSNAMAFEIAGSMAFKEGAKKARPVLLEPVMKFEVVTPEDYLGTIIGDLNSRRAQIHENEPRGNARVVRGIVPLAAMFGYATTVRSLSQGRASFYGEIWNPVITRKFREMWRKKLLISQSAATAPGQRSRNERRRLIWQNLNLSAPSRM